MSPAIRRSEFETLEQAPVSVRRAEFGPVRIAWTDTSAAASAVSSARMAEVFGEQQRRRHAALSGTAAQRFLVGRGLLAILIGELTHGAGIADLGFTTTCERCGADHGRPRLEGLPIAVSISHAGDMVAVAAASQADAAAIGIDIERVPSGGAHQRLSELAPLFAPAPAPDTEGWTLLEAALKADGRGLRVDVSQVQVGEIGTGRWAQSRAVRIAGRGDPVDAGTVAGPGGFVLSAATIPAASSTETPSTAARAAE